MADLHRNGWPNWLGILNHDKKLGDFQIKLDSYEKRGSAIIPYREKPKRAFFHAKILDFYSSETYCNGTLYKESIDILNQAEYQNLILSPTYLEYLFKRRQQSKLSKKIVVISIVDEGLSAYLALSILAGYETYIIATDVFNSYVDGFSEKLGKTIVEIVNGNPFFLLNQDGVTGKYETFIKGESKDVSIDVNLAEKMWPYIYDMINNYADLVSSTESIYESKIAGIMQTQRRRNIESVKAI